jgi:hypothetical protein
MQRLHADDNLPSSTELVRIMGTAPRGSRCRFLGRARESYTALLACGILLALCSPISGVAIATTQLLRVTPPAKPDFVRLREVAPEVGSCGTTVVDGAVEFAAEEGRAAELTAAGFHVEIMHDDLTAFYQSRLRGGGDFGEYHTYPEGIAAMDALVAAYPGLITPKFSIGTTINGLEMWVYKISDNPAVDEDEPEIFFNAYIHAREAITFEVLYGLCDHLLQGHGVDPRATDIVNTREIFVLPFTNPDGVEYNRQIAPGGGGMWRKNRRNSGGGQFGVDLNRNFGYQWGYDNEGSSGSTSSEVYRGTGPFSEPETQAVRQFVNSRNFLTAINLHSYSNLEIFSWGYDTFHHQDYDELLALGRMRRSNNGYDTGTTWEVLYEVNGGANDWMYGEQAEKPKMLSLLTEIGNSNDGFWPAESRIEQLVQENLEGNLTLIEWADNPYRALPPNISQMDAGGNVGPDFLLTWSDPDPDPDNPGLQWNLIEATGHSVGALDFETDPSGRWELDGWNWNGTRAHSGVRSIQSGSDNDLNNVAVSRRGYLVQPGDELRFWTWRNIEANWDYGYVEVSIDNRSFTPIAGSITTNTNPNGRNLGNGITGSNTTWTLATFPLDDYAGQVIWVRFRYQTDGGTAGLGWWIDDVEPSHLFETETLVAEGLTSPEYLFIDHALGEFSFLVQAVDGEGHIAPWSEPRDLIVDSAASFPEGIAAWPGLRLAGQNPFRGVAKLWFTVPSSAQPGEAVVLTVHDVQGRSVGAPVRGHVGQGWADGGSEIEVGGSVIQPGGAVTASWTASRFGSGVYFARLRIGDHESETRLLLLR